MVEQVTKISPSPNEVLPVSGELREMRFSEVHENIDFIFTPLKVLNGKGVDSNNFNTST